MAPRAWAVGLENQDVSDVDLSALEDPQNGVEANSIECADVSNKLDTLAADGEQLSDDTTQLEEIADAVESAEAEGGMDESAARVVDVAVEAIATRWGIRRQKLGLENFNGASKSRGTRVALESIIDTLKDMWHRFVEWLSEVVNKLKDFWIKYFNAGKAIQKRADKLEDRLNKGLGEKSKDNIDGSWLKKLQMNGKVSISEVHDFIKDTKAKKPAKAIADFAEAFANSLKDGSTRVSMDDRIKSLALGTKTTKSFKAALPSDADMLSAHAMPSGNYMVIYRRADIDIGDGSDADRVAKALSVKVLQIDEITGDKKLPTPSTKDMYESIKIIRMIGEELEEDIKDFRTINDKLASARDRVKTAVGDLKSAGEGKHEEMRAKLRLANNSLSNLLQIRRVATAIPQDAATGLIGFVQSGISAYKPVKA